MCLYFFIKKRREAASDIVIDIVGTTLHSLEKKSTKKLEEYAKETSTSDLEYLLDQIGQRDHINKKLSKILSVIQPIYDQRVKSERSVPQMRS